MYLFKNKKKELRQENNFPDKVAAGIVQKCIKLQLRWADFMQQKTEKFSLKARKWGLLLFCCLSAGCSLYLVVESLRSNKKPVLAPSLIQVPIHSTRTGEENTQSILLITKGEYQKIERFRLYVDSLGRSPQGAATRDSLLFHRPGLMDSIRAIENLYRLQTQKK